MKNLMLSTSPHARAWSVEHAYMRCFVRWVDVSCLIKRECPRVKSAYVGSFVLVS
jgi:hypothetical protein